VRPASRQLTLHLPLGEAAPHGQGKEREQELRFHTTCEKISLWKLVAAHDMSSEAARSPRGFCENVPPVDPVEHRSVFSAIFASRVALVLRCPISTSQLHFARLLTQSRKFRACGAVSAVEDPRFFRASTRGFAVLAITGNPRRA